MATLQDLLLLAPVLLFSMVAHEYAHGWAAFHQGDPTAKQLGRLTWNPIKHIDPIFTILLPLLTWRAGFIFGGAKPVPVDPRNYRHYRRGDIIVSLAGVTTNVLLALLFAALVAPIGMAGHRAAPWLHDSLAIVQHMLLLGIQVNLVLAAFNLLPIPPLDGSHVVKHLLPAPLALLYVRVGRYGILVLMLLLAARVRVLDWWMRPVQIANTAVLRAVYSYILPSPWTT